MRIRVGAGNLGRLPPQRSELKLALGVHQSRRRVGKRRKEEGSRLRGQVIKVKGSGEVRQEEPLRFLSKGR